MVVDLVSIVGLAITATLLVSSLRRVDSKIRDAVIAFTNMSSNFSGVPLSFAFIIILGTNGAITLLLKQYGLLGDFDLYGGELAGDLHLLPDPISGVVAVSSVRCIE